MKPPSRVCPTCHLVGPCDCGDPRVEHMAEVEVVRLRETPRIRPVALRSLRPPRARLVPPAGGTCPLEHFGPDGVLEDPPVMDDGRYVCDRCMRRLRGLLTGLPQLVDDLRVALAGQARFSEQRSGRRAEAIDEQLLGDEQTAAATKTPVAWGASRAMHDLRQVVMANLQWVIGLRGHEVPATWAAIADYLRDALPWAARHPDGPQIVEELTVALVAARRSVDRPPDQHYLGECGGVLIDADELASLCPEPLYGPDRGTVTCVRCGTEWKVADRHAAQAKRIENHELTATDMSRVLAGVGIDIPAAQIRQWKRRKEISSSGANRKGTPLYRVGDVLARRAKSETDTPDGAEGA